MITIKQVLLYIYMQFTSQPCGTATVNVAEVRENQDGWCIKEGNLTNDENAGS